MNPINTADDVFDGEAMPFAYVHPGDELPGFRQLVLRHENGLVVPLIDEMSGTVAGFEAARDFDKPDLIPINAATTVRVGDKALYAYKFPHYRGDATLDLIVGDKTSVSLAVSRRMKRLRQYPFARLEAAAFMHDRSRTERYAREAAANYILSNDAATLAQIQAAISPYLADSPSRDRVLMTEFCRGLISYYRLYSRLLHVSEPGMRRRLESRFNSSARFIMPFLIDDDFLIRIEREAEGILLDDGDVTVAGKVKEDVVHVLTQLGVSRSSSAHFMRRVTDLFSTQEELPLALSLDPIRRDVDHQRLSRAGLLVPLTYSAIRHREVLDQSLGRWEKRLHKRRLDTNFASLAYGLLIIIQAEVAPFRYGAELKSFGQASLSAGLRALSYGYHSPTDPKRRSAPRSAKNSP